MRKIFLTAVAVVSLIACNQAEQPVNNPSNNIIFIDSSKMLEQYQGAIDIEAKFKAKSEQMGKELDAEVSKFRADVAFFEQNAQSKGMQWAQQTGAALQEREQRLAYTQQAMMQELQSESGAEMDTLVKEIKSLIKEHGKAKGYDFILSTADEINNVLYAKEGKDITEDIIKLLNDNYKAKKSKEDDIEIEVDSAAQE